jgi:hypothetical protein
MLATKPTHISIKQSHYFIGEISLYCNLMAKVQYIQIITLNTSYDTSNSDAPILLTKFGPMPK